MSQISTPIYCGRCDEYFSMDNRQTHIQSSSNHPECTDCKKRFLNGHALRKHWARSKKHHYCIACDVMTKTAAGMRFHMSWAAVHCTDVMDDDDSEDEYGDDDDDDDDDDDWFDAQGARLYPEMVSNSEMDDQSFEKDKADTEWDDSFSDAGSECSSCPTCRDYADDDDDSSGPHSELNKLIEGLPSMTIADRIAKLMQCQSADSASPTPSPPAPKSKPTNRVLSGTPCFTCPMCLEDATEVSATRCGHTFCTSCIHQSFRRSKTCPICRTPALKRQLRKIIAA